MEQYLQDKLASTPVAKWVRFYGLDDPAAFIEDIEWLSRQVSGSVYKRIQTPPTIAVVRDTVSYDFRENQARYEASDRYRELRASILSMDNAG
jgi:NAD+ synthase (glutamine-hydrolysing)